MLGLNRAAHATDESVKALSVSKVSARLNENDKTWFSYSQR
jgi:hypothetical protein